MKALLLLTVLVVSLPQQNPIISESSPDVTVVDQKWSRDKLSAEESNSAVVPPIAAMIPQNKNFERLRRASAPPGERDPNEDTVDGRSAAMERSVQQSRAAKPIEGYTYRAKFKNSSRRVIDIIFWEYQFRESAASQYLTRRQFLCAVSFKPDKEKELKGFSLSGPSDVVSVGALKKDGDKAFLENVIVNRVEFTDGTIWQRKDWKFEEIRLTYRRALDSPWTPDMCKGL